MDIEEKRYAIGFNSGYLLAKHEPQLLNALLKNIKPINSFISGLLFGKKEYELEITNIRLNELEQLKNNNSREKDL